MARTTALVDGATLVLPERDAGPITVDTPEWFAWLDHATTFAFTGPAGRFTARKEQQARGGGYWKAYRTDRGTLHRSYLGKAQDLTLDRLNRAAATLAAAIAAPTPPPAAPAPPARPAAAAALPSDLLATKLFTPPPRANLVARPRLFERLQAGLREKLTLVAAPAGFGKTTLLSAWRATAAGSALRFGWVSLDSTDNDPLRFWSYLLTALDTLVPGVGTTALGLLQSPQPPPIERILTGVVNALAAAPPVGDVALVLDDYHVITTPAIHDGLATLLEYAPPQLHLVILTRADPALPLPRLRARGSVTELRAHDLRFTPDEAAAFLNQVMGLALTAADLAALEARTEGWIAGLQLAALAMRNHQDRSSFIRSFRGSNRYIMDYLATEVFASQPAHIQTFLLHTSILDRMCGSLCDAVLLGGTEHQEPRTTGDTLVSRFSGLGSGTSYSQLILEQLERDNLFLVPLDDERQWYRYHHLFADLLRQRLDQSTAAPTQDTQERAAELHRRASQWYEDHGLEIEAFQHAAAANDVERAERLIEGTGVPLPFRGAGALVLRWLQSLPPAVLNARPSLWATYASACMMTGQHSIVEEKLQAAEGALHGCEMDDRARDLVGRIASLRATVAIIHHDAETIIAQSHRALAYLHPDNLPARTAATYTLGYAYQLGGDRVAASQAYREVIATSRSFGTSIYTTAATLGLSQLHEADTQLVLATEHYRDVLVLASDPPQPIACEAHLGLARISYEWNDLKAAEQHAQQCLQLMQQMESTDSFVSYAVFLARLRLAQADLPLCR